MTRRTRPTIRDWASASTSRSRRQPRSQPAELPAPPPALGYRVAAFDLGERHIGIALTDQAGSFAAHRRTIERSGVSADRLALADVLNMYSEAVLVVGLPLNMDGSEGFQARRTREWAAQMFQGRSERIVFRDERLTTFSAETADVRADEVHARSAEVLLLDYLMEPNRE